MMSTFAKPKVIGLGLSKTGTKSLQAALISIGYSNYSWDPVLHEKWHAGNLAAVFEVTDAHDCVEDWPFCGAYRELIDRYGADARYVLTTRKTPEIWLDSVIVHAKRVGPQYDKHRRMAFGYENPSTHPAEYVEFYKQHNEAVVAEIKRRNLDDCFIQVCWENGDGWGKLCRLIGYPTPHHPFPHENRRPASLSAA